jgi:hypothetical protein
MLSMVALCKRSSAALDEMVGVLINFFLPPETKVGTIGGGREGLSLGFF